MAKMTQQEIEQWDQLYEYVRTKIMGYDENQSLSTKMVLRLKGLATNKYIANNHIKDTAHYSYAVILTTFKYCYFDIQRSIYGLNFQDEFHKFNYILKIVESKLNTVYLRIKESQSSQKEMDMLLNSISLRGQDGQYNPQPKKRQNPLIDDDIW